MDAKIYKVFSIIFTMFAGTFLDQLIYVDGDSISLVIMSIMMVCCLAGGYVFSKAAKDLENEDTEKDEVEEEA